MRVLNKKTDAIPPGAVYIGRPSIFGNPYRIGKSMTRETVIGLYRNYFKMRLRTDPDFKKAVDSLKGKDLVCWCAPLSCHGDVIVEYLRNQNLGV